MNLEHFFNERRYSVIRDEFPCKIKYPKYYEARKTEFTIGPGQKLFIPAGWFHFVFSEGVEEESGLNMAINHWFIAKDSFEEGKSTGDDIPYVAGHNIPNLDLSQYIPDEEEVRFVFSEDGIYGTVAIGQNHADTKYTYMKWGDYYKNRRTDGYMIQQEFPWLEQFVDVPPDRVNKASSMWVNFGNVRTYIHYDLDDNFLCQIKGTKRVLLFPPEDRDLLYMFNSYSLDTIFKLEQAWNVWDFVARSIHPIAKKPEIVDYLLKRLGSDEFTEVEDHLFGRDYMDLVNKYHEMLHVRGCLPDYTIDRIKFHASRGSGLGKLDFVNPFINMVLFITEGTIKIASSEFPMGVGSVVCFPNMFTYPWAISEGAVVIIAAEAQQSTQLEHSAYRV